MTRGLLQRVVTENLWRAPPHRISDESVDAAPPHSSHATAPADAKPERSAATGDRDNLRGDIAVRRRTEEQDDVGHILRAAEPAGRGALDLLFLDRRG